VISRLVGTARAAVPSGRSHLVSRWRRDTGEADEAAPLAIPKAFGVEVFEPGTARPTARYRHLDD